MHLPRVMLVRDLPFSLPLSVVQSYMTAARKVISREGLDDHRSLIWRSFNMPLSEARASEVLPPPACDATSAFNTPFLVYPKSSDTCGR